MHAMVTGNASRKVNGGEVRKHTVWLLFLFFLFAAGGVQAQPELEIQRVAVNWPDIEITFQARCQGVPRYDISAQDLRVYDDGVPVPDFTLQCPDPSSFTPLSVALVFDASGSMTGAFNDGAKAGGRAFIDRMDGIVDEACVIFFNYSVSVFQQMTTNKPMLYSAVDALFSSGGTALWDAMYAGIDEVANDGVNPIQAVVVLTDGLDNNSTKTAVEVRMHAVRHRIPLYIIGLGGNINTQVLQDLAQQTGGKFYATGNPLDLPGFYADIHMELTAGQQRDCVVSYQRDCADGMGHVAELEIVNFCGGTASDSRGFTVPLDSSTYSTLDMDLADMQVSGGTEISVPLDLRTQLDDDMFERFSFTVMYDDACLTWRGVGTAGGTLLDGASVSTVPHPGGMRVTVDERRLLQGSGPLLHLFFRAAEVQDTTCCTVAVIDAGFETGCHLSEVDDAEICILPAVGEVWACEIVVPVIVVDTVLQGYDPMPFTVSVGVKNVGTLPVGALTAELGIVGDLEFTTPDSPLSAVKPVTPSSLDPGLVGNVNWRLLHPETAIARDYTIRVVVRSANDSTVCHARIHIPAMQMPPFSYDIVAEGPLMFCEGESVVLDGGAGYLSWKWNSGEETRKITVTQSGDYWCEVERSDGRRGISNTVTVVAFPAAQKPVVTRNGDVLLSTSAVAYQWQRDGSDLPGRNDQHLVITETGRYRVCITDQHGCEACSDEFNVTVLGIEQPPVVLESVALYPDPASDAVTLELQLGRAVPVDIILTNALGQELLRLGSAGPVRTFSRQLPLTGAPGVYFLRIHAGGETSVRRVLKAR